MYACGIPAHLCGHLRSTRAARPSHTVLAMLNNPQLVRAAWISLSQIPGLGRQTIAQAIRQTGSLHALLTAPESELCRLPRIGPKTARAIRHIDLPAMSHRLDEWEANEIAVLTLDDPRYPRELAACDNAPLALFWRGQPDPGRRRVAIIGTRRPAPAAARYTHALAQDLAAHGITVVSGLASGIDTAAHQGCLDRGGCTLAVLGSGVNAPYPPENQALSQHIRTSGALLSETIPDQHPTSASLVARNRIISGLSAAVVVIESGTSGGSLHTVRFAQAQGRPVYAVDWGTAGAAQLLAQGAHPVPARDHAALLDQLLESE